MFSLGPSKVGMVCQYIARQGEHHQHEGFQDEYRRFLRAAGIDFDERYVWD